MEPFNQDIGNCQTIWLVRFVLLNQDIGSWDVTILLTLVVGKQQVNVVVEHWQLDEK